jgi:chorismate synthase
MALRFLTAGESHGRALVGVLEGLPSGIPVALEQLREQLKRRRLGFGRSARQNIEEDAVEVLSGLRGDRTLGSPVALVLPNQDYRDETGLQPVSAPRPGHAELVGSIKHPGVDLRDVMERASARETAMRVAVGTLCRRLLEELGLSLASRVVRIGEVEDAAPLRLAVERVNAAADRSPVRCLDPKASRRMVRAIEEAERAGDTLGGVFEVLASGAPAGLGSYAHWDRRLDGRVAAAFMALNAVKGVELGLGFEAARRKGSVVHDEYFPGKGWRGVAYRTNRSGGVDGGMTTGQPLVVRAAMKPLPTLGKPLRSVDLRTGRPSKAYVTRADVCAVPAAAVIGESLLAIELARAVLEKFGGVSLGEVRERVERWRRH